MRLHSAQQSRPRRGEIRSGDVALVRSEPGVTLLALVDALGHGDAAADVADRATLFLQQAALDDVRSLVGGLHRALRGSRGAAATLCLFKDGELEVAGVGNVGLRVFGSPFSVILTPGILGARLRDLRVLRGRVGPKTRLVLFSDGVRADFGEAAKRGSPEEACFTTLNLYGREEDDSTILIVDVK